LGLAYQLTILAVSGLVCLTALMPPLMSTSLFNPLTCISQDDFAIGDGIPPIPEWQFDSTALDSQSFDLSTIEVDYAVNNVFNRLRNIFQPCRV
jgi:hypothetical protein